jgi:drug/metabolite transporter (DMT)-like permease
VSAIPEIYVGYAAGLSVSVLWTATSLFFTAAGQRLGATVVNAVRILLAVGLLGVTHRLQFGAWVPPATAGQVLFLAASGLVGLSVGDQALFTAFVRIGPRLAMLIMTTAPLFAALFGWVALGETIRSTAWVGIGLTIGGVAWVVLERPRRKEAFRGGSRAGGMALAFVAAACQAGGLLLSKMGMGYGWMPAGEGMAPLAATLVRMFFAAFGMLPIFYLYRVRERRLRAAGVVRRREGGVPLGLLLAAGGAVVGPYLGVWMSLEAGARVPIGVAQTLCALPPVLILPVSRLVYRESISSRAVFGALIAVAGVATLWLQAGGGFGSGLEDF